MRESSSPLRGTEDETMTKIECPMCHYCFGESKIEKDELKRQIINELILLLKEQQPTAEKKQ
jgi:hypothetical protein